MTFKSTSTCVSFLLPGLSLLKSNLYFTNIGSVSHSFRFGRFFFFNFSGVVSKATLEKALGFKINTVGTLRCVRLKIIYHELLPNQTDMPF